MDAFALSEKQAEYIAEIKLRHLNREYILNRITEIEDLQKEMAKAIETQNFERAAAIRDEIKQLKGEN